MTDRVRAISRIAYPAKPTTSTAMATVATSCAVAGIVVPSGVAGKSKCPRIQVIVAEVRASRPGLAAA